MILNDISLQVRVKPKDRRRVPHFGYESRTIGVYLRRRVRAMNYRTEGFNVISISVRENVEKLGYINTSQVLCVDVAFNYEDIENTPKSERLPMYADLYRKGITDIDPSIDFPRDALLGWINEMEADGWRNEWVHRTRLIKELKVKCRMNCRITMDAFELSVDIIRGKEILLSRKVLTTKPDELAFHRFVDTADFHEDRIRILGKRGKLVAEIPVSDIPL